MVCYYVFLKNYEDELPADLYCDVNCLIGYIRKNYCIETF